MSKETKETKLSRLEQIIARLKKTYPDAHCELNHSNPLELLVATILSAQCTDKQVNVVTEGLFKKYRSAADYARVPLDELCEDVKRIGFYRNKAKNIQECCRKIVELHQGKVPDSMEALVQLNGVGRKTANVVLGNAFGINSGIVVDTHVVRLTQKMGLVSESNPEKIEQALLPMVPQKEWTLFSHLIIWHGRRRCSARKPDCDACEIADICPKLEVK